MFNLHTLNAASNVNNDWIKMTELIQYLWWQWPTIKIHLILFSNDSDNNNIFSNNDRMLTWDMSLHHATFSCNVDAINTIVVLFEAPLPPPTHFVSTTIRNSSPLQSAQWAAPAGPVGPVVADCCRKLASVRVEWPTASVVWAKEALVAAWKEEKKFDERMFDAPVSPWAAADPS